VYSFKFLPETDGFYSGYYDSFQLFVLMISQEVGVIFLSGIVIIFTKNNRILTCGCVALICVNTISILDEVYGWNEITVWPVLIVTSFLLSIFTVFLKVANLLVVSKDAYVDLKNDLVSDTVKNVEEELESLNEKKKVGEITPTQYHNVVLRLYKSLTDCHNN
tara:strand:+ start:3790 stop:4278 length:489 start_codon:yes stop_codon:yes gene_type:complete